MKNLTIFTAGIIVLCTSSCRESIPCDVFPDSSLVTKFPEENLIMPDSLISREDIYIKGFSLYDSLLFIETNNSQGSWNIISLNTFQNKKSIFPLGHASNEFLSSPSCWKAKFETKHDSIYTILYDFSAGRAYKANLSRDSEQAINKVERLQHETPKFLDRYLYISDSSYIIRRNTRNKHPKEFTMYVEGKSIKKNCLNFFNQIIVPDDDGNTLAATLEYNELQDKLIMAHHYSNTINILSLKNDLGKSITLGERPFPLEDIIENRNKRNDYFLSISCQKEYFAILCFRWKKILFSILTFDYDGHPLKEYDIKEKIGDFEIDETNRHIYALDFENGIILRYSF